MNDFSHMIDYLDNDYKPIRIDESAFEGLDDWNMSTDYWILEF